MPAGVTRGPLGPSSNMVVTGQDANGQAMFGPRPPAPATPLQNQYSLYNSGVAQNANDKDEIMSGFRSLLSNRLPMMQAGTYTPQTYNYAPSADYKQAAGTLKELTDTGGYTQQGLNDIRERGISPIRSVYANAQRNVDRNRRLQGGFSPNYNAVTAKMAREMSDQIGTATTNVNAGLAQNVAQNRLSIAPTYANTVQRESETAADYGRRNVDSVNEANRFNIQMPLQYGQYNMANQGQALGALQGMTSLYGTTPALSQLFGNQAMDRAQFENLMSQQQSQNGLQALSGMMRYA